MRIKLEKITRNYGEIPALRGISLEVNDGEIMTVLGPSGCGKTTMLRVIAGLLEPDSGRIFFGERDVTALPPEKRRVGMVFQNYALFPHMDISENIGFGLRMRGSDKGHIRKRVEEALSLVGLDGYEKRMPSELSGGEQQRVALARAIAPEPDILLLDEPLSALDAGLRISLRHDIRSIQRELGITTIYVTHDRDEAMDISDRIAVLNRGRLEQEGEPEEIYRRPVNPFVARFLGDANLINVNVTNGTARTPFGNFRGDFEGRGYLFFRPGDCTISDDGMDEGIEVEVISSRIRGGLLEITVKYGEERIKLHEKESLARKYDIRPGKRIKVRIDTDAIILLKP